MNPLMADEAEMRRQQVEHEQRLRERRVKQMEKVRCQIFQSIWKTLGRLFSLGLLITAFCYRTEIHDFATVNINQVVSWMKNLGTSNSSQPAGHISEVSKIVQ